MTSLSGRILQILDDLLIKLRARLQQENSIVNTEENIVVVVKSDEDEKE